MPYFQGVYYDESEYQLPAGLNAVTITMPGGGTAQAPAEQAYSVLYDWNALAQAQNIPYTPQIGGSPTNLALALQNAPAQTAQVTQAGLPLAGIAAAIPAIVKGVSTLGGSIPTWLTALIGAAGLAGGAVGLSQLFGDELAGTTIPGTNVVLGGPGAAEPSAAMIVKEWAGFGGSRYYLLNDKNKSVVIRKANGKEWVKVRRPHMLHLKITNPRMGDVVKADKVVARVAKILRRRLK